MFQRFASALFGADLGDSRPEGVPSVEESEEEEEEEWILVNYLTESCSGSVSALGPGGGDEEEEEEEEEDVDHDLVMLPSPTSPPMVRCPSLTSLNSTATEPDDTTATGPDQDPSSDQDSDQDYEDFLRLDPGCLEESWFVTPPACFTRAQHLPLEPSPLENLLIEHPSMSVYLLPLHGNDGRLHPQHGNRPRPPHLSSKPRPPHLQRAPGNGNKPGSNKKAKRGAVDSKHRPEGIQRRPPSSCLSASLAAHVSASGRLDVLQPRPPHSLSKNALRRLNPQRPPKTAALQLHQPSHRQLNF